MVAPIDYSSQIQNPFAQALQGLQFGAGIAQLQSAQKDQALKQQAQQQALLQQQEANQIRQRFFANPKPTMRDAALLASVIPKDQADAIRPFIEGISKEQQQGVLKFNAEALMALETRPQVAIDLLRQRAQAERENGDEDEAALYERIATSAENDGPEVAFKGLSAITSALPGAKEMFESASKLGAERRAAEKAPSELSESQAKAQKAAVDAKFAESNAVIELQKKGWDITKIQEDIGIAKQNARIAAANAATAREGNSLKREEMGLKVQEMKQKRDELVQGKAAEIESARSGIDNALSVFDRLLKNPELDNVLGSVEGSDFFPSTAVALFAPGADADERANALADIENVKSQAFVNNLLDAKAKGATFGSLTEKEGDRLIGFVRNLTTKQGEKQFRENVTEIQRLLLKSRASLAKKFGVPDTIPDTPAVESGAGDIEALLKKYGAQ